MTAIEVFQFPVTGQSIRTVLVDGKPGVVGVDVCAVLGLGNPRSSLALLDDDEKGVHTVDTPGGPQRLTVVTEPGLYSLILRSRKPEARAFKRWITHEVLPAIRKTGGYGRELSRLELIELAREAEVERLAALQRADAAEHQVAELEPRAAQADQHRAADGLIAVGDFANKLKAWARREHGVRVLHQRVWDFLGDINLLIRGDTIRRNHPTAFAVERDFVRLKETEFEGSTGKHTSASPRLTPAGEGWAWDRAVARIADHGDLTPGRSVRRAA